MGVFSLVRRASAAALIVTVGLALCASEARASQPLAGFLAWFVDARLARVSPQSLNEQLQALDLRAETAFENKENLILSAPLPFLGSDARFRFQPTGAADPDRRWQLLDATIDLAHTTPDAVHSIVDDLTRRYGRPDLLTDITGEESHAWWPDRTVKLILVTNPKTGEAFLSFRIPQGDGP